MISKGTFGGSNAGKKLDTLLNESKDERAIHFCARLIEQFKYYLDAVRDIKISARHNFRLLVKDKIFQGVDNGKDKVNPTILSVLKTHLTTMFRREQEQDKEWIATTPRRKRNDDGLSGGESCTHQLGEESEKHQE
jgi:hypothetical protein